MANKKYQTTGLIDLVKNIVSPNETVLDTMQPKVVRGNEGVYLNTANGKFYFIRFEDQSAVEILEVVPVFAIFPNAKGNYSQKFVSTKHEIYEVTCEFCGEADDKSCFLYFYDAEDVEEERT